MTLAERSAAVHGGRCWSTAGGAIESGETPADAAMREATEELAGVDHVTLGGPLIAPCADGCGWSYTTYPARLASNGSELPAISVGRGPHQWETREVRWFPADELPANLHPGLATALPALRELISDELVGCGC